LLAASIFVGPSDSFEGRAGKRHFFSPTFLTIAPQQVLNPTQDVGMGLSLMKSIYCKGLHKLRQIEQARKHFKGS
jgi:hypothetical protein